MTGYGFQRSRLRVAHFFETDSGAREYPAFARPVLLRLLKQVAVTAPATQCDDRRGSLVASADSVA